jgi:hypothetical protein
VTYGQKFGICVILGLVGFYFVMARMSVETLVAGFLVVALAVAFGYYYLARWRQPKNDLEGAISTLSKIGEENLRKQEEQDAADRKQNKTR